MARVGVIFDLLGCQVADINGLIRSSIVNVTANIAQVDVMEVSGVFSTATAKVGVSRVVQTTLETFNHSSFGVNATQTSVQTDIRK